MIWILVGIVVIVFGSIFFYDMYQFAEGVNEDARKETYKMKHLWPSDTSQYISEDAYKKIMSDTSGDTTKSSK